MASSYLVQVALTHDSGLPEDVCVNTWSCRTTSTDDLTALGDFCNALESFYSSWDGDLSASLTGGVVIKAYDRADAEPRVPVFTDTWTLGPGTEYLPSEVALCMSFQGDAVSGVAQARRRGRVFLGPFSTTILDESTGRPDGTRRAIIVAAGAALLADSVSSGAWDWTVWSSVNGSDTVVTNGWIDNSFDTIRSRGIAANSRTLF